MSKAMDESIISFPMHIMLAGDIAELNERRAAIWLEAEKLDEAAGKLRRGDPRRAELHKLMLEKADAATSMETDIIHAQVSTVGDLVKKICAIGSFEYDDDSDTPEILKIIEADIQHLAASRGRELRPEEVLSDLFAEDEFLCKLPADTDGAAAMAVQRLVDAGFEIVPAS